MRFVQEEVMNVDEKTKRGASLLSVKHQVRRTVSDDDRLQQQQQQQLPVLTTQHLSPAKNDFTSSVSPLSSAGLTMWQMWQMPRASGLRGTFGSRENFVSPSVIK